MLLCIHIENMAVIKNADIEFSDGFNVLTGETGAGKSILIDSINLLLGERTSRSVIRHGEKSAVVSGLFIIPQSKNDFLAEYGVEPEEDGTILISREIFSDGKNICRINGKMSTVSVLKELGKHLIVIHGQHDNQLLLDHKTHIDYLDLFIAEKDNFPATKTEYEIKYKELLAHRRSLSELSIDEDEKIRRMDILKYEIDELTAADLKEDEEDALKKRRDMIQSARELIKNTSVANQMLYAGDEANAYGLVLSAISLIEDIAGIDPDLSEHAESLNSAAAIIEDTARFLSRYIDNFEENGENLDEIESRLDVIYKMKRKYGGSVESAIKMLDSLTQEYESIKMSDEKKAELEKNISLLTKDCEKLSASISDTRQKFAPILSGEINEALKFLDMPGAEFDVSFDEIPFSQKGTDNIEFLITTNKGEPKKPLGKIISGGELSRIMLAIMSIMPQNPGEPSMIFDEIDTGVSGRAAQKIATKISSLSKNNQVLCVTHLAQIASQADTHFLIEKLEDNEKTFTTVKKLKKEGRIDEIARIIGGDSVTDTTKKQAEEMLKL